MRQGWLVAAGVTLMACITTPAHPYVNYETQELLPPNAVGHSLYGWDVALLGDRAIVTAPRLGGGSWGGGAFAFARVGGVWQFQEVLPTPNGSKPASTQAVIRGTVAMVSRTPALDGGSEFDHVTFFEKVPSGWVVDQTIPSPGAGSFGRAVDLDGDWAAVGRPQYASNAHGAHIYRRLSGTWLEQQALMATPDGEPTFGDAVALDGDTLAVGAMGTEHDGDGWVGAVHVFVRDPMTDLWELQQVLLPPTPTEGLYFGGALALAGDTLFVAGYEWIQFTNAPVWIFERVGSVWTHTASLTSPNQSGSIGADIALSNHTAIVGALGAQPGGGAYVYVRLASGSWSLQQELLRTQPEISDRLGWSVAMDGPDALVGAPGINGGSAFGTALHFYLPAPLGLPCGVTEHCESGLCVDDVCCSDACGNGAPDCQACSVAAGAAEDGICGPVVVSGISCRDAVGACDAAEYCAPGVPTCPPDESVIDGTPCDDGTGCTDDDHCIDGVCVDGGGGCGAPPPQGGGGAGGADQPPGSAPHDIRVTSSCGCHVVGDRGGTSPVWPWMLLVPIISRLNSRAGRRLRTRTLAQAE